MTNRSSINLIINGPAATSTTATASFSTARLSRRSRLRQRIAIRQRLAYGWVPDPAIALHPTYRYRRYDVSAADGAAAIPMTNHDVELAGTYTRRLSPSRQLEISGGGGATYVSTAQSINHRRLTYQHAVGSGITPLDLFRSWAVVGQLPPRRKCPPGDQPRVVCDRRRRHPNRRAPDPAHSGDRADRIFQRPVGRRSDQAARYASVSTSLRVRYDLGRCCAHDDRVRLLQLPIPRPDRLRLEGFRTPTIARPCGSGSRSGFLLYGRYVDGRRARQTLGTDHASQPKNTASRTSLRSRRRTPLLLSRHCAWACSWHWWCRRSCRTSIKRRP